MGWNYRLVKREYPTVNSIEQVLEIKEVYYDENNNPHSLGDAPVPYGESVEEVKECLDLMYKALNKPVLNYSDIVKSNTATKVTCNAKYVGELQKKQRRE